MHEWAFSFAIFSLFIQLHTYCPRSRLPVIGLSDVNRLFYISLLN